jgi:hypothetical protein
VLLLSLLYLYNNLNYTQNSNHSAELHLGQLIDTIEGRGEVLKSNRYYRPLFLRTLVQRNSSGYSNNRGGFRERFDVKRPRLVSPSPKPWMDAQRSLQNSPVFQLNGSLGNPVQGRSSPLLTSSEPRSPVDQSSVTRASESSATNRSKARVCEQD